MDASRGRAPGEFTLHDLLDGSGNARVDVTLFIDHILRSNPAELITRFNDLKIAESKSAANKKYGESNLAAAFDKDVEKTPALLQSMLEAASDETGFVTEDHDLRLQRVKQEMISAMMLYVFSHGDEEDCVQDLIDVIRKHGSKADILLLDELAVPQSSVITSTREFFSHIVDESEKEDDEEIEKRNDQEAKSIRETLGSMPKTTRSLQDVANTLLSCYEFQFIRNNLAFNENAFRVIFNDANIDSLMEKNSNKGLFKIASSLENCSKFVSRALYVINESNDLTTPEKLLLTRVLQTMNETIDNKKQELAAKFMAWVCALEDDELHELDPDDQKRTFNCPGIFQEKIESVRNRTLGTDKKKRITKGMRSDERTKEFVVLSTEDIIMDVFYICKYGAPEQKIELLMHQPEIAGLLMDQQEESSHERDDESPNAIDVIANFLAVTQDDNDESDEEEDDDLTEHNETDFTTDNNVEDILRDMEEHTAEVTHAWLNAKLPDWQLNASCSPQVKNAVVNMISNHSCISLLDDEHINHIKVLVKSIITHSPDESEMLKAVKSASERNLFVNSNGFLRFCKFAYHFRGSSGHDASKVFSHIINTCQTSDDLDSVVAEYKKIFEDEPLRKEQINFIIHLMDTDKTSQNMRDILFKDTASLCKLLKLASIANTQEGLQNVAAAIVNFDKMLTRMTSIEVGDPLFRDDFQACLQGFIGIGDAKQQQFVLSLLTESFAKHSIDWKKLTTTQQIYFNLMRTILHTDQRHIAKLPDLSDATFKLVELLHDNNKKPHDEKCRHLLQVVAASLGQAALPPDSPLRAASSFAPQRTAVSNTLKKVKTTAKYKSAWHRFVSNFLAVFSFISASQQASKKHRHKASMFATQASSVAHIRTHLHGHAKNEKSGSKSPHKKTRRS